MTFDLIPGNREVIAILAAHVQGAYHFVHDALKPYVQLQPAEIGQSIVVTSSPQLQLLRGAKHRQVSEAITFVIMFQGSGMQLLEVLQVSTTDRAVALPHTLQLGHVDVQVVAEGEHPQSAPMPRAPRIRVAPEPPPAPAPPPISIPAVYRSLCTAYDVHPELGDYLVMPRRAAILPEVPWIVCSPLVTGTHVVKRRLGTDEIVPDGLSAV